MGQFVILRIEMDGYSPRPWVAAIVGLCPRRTFAREFVRPMHDYRNARQRGVSKRVTGVAATFVLREGGLYEVSRCRGLASRKFVVREFVRATDGDLWPMTAEEVLACLL